jgi:hypothetical protein
MVKGSQKPGFSIKRPSNNIEEIYINDEQEEL